MKKIFGMLLVLTVLSFPAQAAEFDPLARNLIYVKGEAEISVPVDTFEVRFSWEVNKGSFENVIQDSAASASKIESYVKNLGKAQVEVVRGWDLVRQERISFGAKGRKVTNALSVRVTGFPQGKMYEWIAKVIDYSLSVDSAIALEDVDVSLSPVKEEASRSEVMVQAVKNLNANASAAITSLGKSVSGAKQIFVSDSDNSPVPMQAMYRGALLAERAGGLSSAVNIQKSFKVRAQIADQIKLHATVSGVYEMN